jgi:hypothetical protein
VRFSLKEYPAESTSPTTWYSPACGIEYEGEIICGGYNGLMQRHYKGNLFNDKTPVSIYRTADIVSPTPIQESAQHRAQIQCYGNAQNFQVTFFTQGPDADGSLKRREVYKQQCQSTQNGCILGSWILGTNALAGPFAQIFEIESIGGGRTWDMEFLCDQPDSAINLIGIFVNLIGGGTRQ